MNMSHKVKKEEKNNISWNRLFDYMNMFFLAVGLLTHLDTKLAY